MADLNIPALRERLNEIWTRDAAGEARKAEWIRDITEALPTLLDAAEAMGLGSRAVVERLREQRAEIDRLRTELDFARVEAETERDARIYANQIYNKLSDEEIKARALLERAVFGDRADDIGLPSLPLAELVHRALDAAGKDSDA